MPHMSLHEWDRQSEMEVGEARPRVAHVRVTGPRVTRAEATGLHMAWSKAR